MCASLMASCSCQACRACVKSTGRVTSAIATALVLHITGVSNVAIYDLKMGNLERRLEVPQVSRLNVRGQKIRGFWASEQTSSQGRVDGSTGMTGSGSSVQ